MNFSNVALAYRTRIDRALRIFLARETRRLPTLRSDILRLEHRLVARSCEAAGKRLRPMLTLLCYRAVGGKNEKSMLEPALAFELFHAYTLAHDDVYDEDILRRNEPTLHAGLSGWYREQHGTKKVPTRLFRDRAVRFGIIGGVLGGEMLHNLCIRVILNAKISDGQRLEGMRIYSETGPADNACQMLDLALETEELTENKYWELARYKSGKLLSAAAEWGVVLGGGTPSQRQAVGGFAELIGQAFQVKDDLLDIGVGGKKGRPIGSDIREGKKTLVFHRALRTASPKDRKLLMSAFGKVAAKQNLMRDVIHAIIQRTDSVAYCERAAQKKIQQAIRALRAAKPPLQENSRMLLEDLAEHVLGRRA